MMGNINPAFLCKFSLYFSAERTKTPLFCYTNPERMLRKLRSGTKTIHIHKDSLQQASMLWFSGFVPLESSVFQIIQLQGALQRRHRHICAWNHEGGLQNTAWNLVVVVWNSKWHQGEEDWKSALCSAREGAAKGFPTNQIIPSMNKHPQTRGDPRKERDLLHLGKRGGERQAVWRNGCNLPYNLTEMLLGGDRFAGGTLGVPKVCVHVILDICIHWRIHLHPQKGRDQHCQCFTALASHRAGSRSFRPRLRGHGDATAPLPSHFCHRTAQGSQQRGQGQGQHLQSILTLEGRNQGLKVRFPPCCHKGAPLSHLPKHPFWSFSQSKEKFMLIAQLLEAPLQTPNKH